MWWYRSQRYTWRWHIRDIVGMVYSAELGYDPDEWEECDESHKFMVFSPVTRVALSVAAITFTYYFFKLIDKHAKKEDEEDNKVEESSGGLLSSIGAIAMAVVQGLFAAGGSAQESFAQHGEEIKQGASKLYETTSANLESTAQRGQVLAQKVTQAGQEAVHAAAEKIPSGQEAWQSVSQTGADAAAAVSRAGDKALQAASQAGQGVTETVRHAGEGVAEALHQIPSNIERLAEGVASNMPATQRTPQEEDALLEWERDLARIEQERLAKLEEREVGGESSVSNLSTESKVIDAFLPADHISIENIDDAHLINRPFDTAAPSDSVDSRLNEIRQGLEQKLMSEIGELAAREGLTAETPQWSRQSGAESDFEVRLNQEGQKAEAPLQLDQRTPARGSNDSDEFVKIDVPPVEKKQISAEEEEQLKALIDEYDLGDNETPRAAPQERKPFLPTQESLPSETSQDIPIHFVEQEKQDPPFHQQQKEQDQQQKLLLQQHEQQRQEQVPQRPLEDQAQAAYLQEEQQFVQRQMPQQEQQFTAHQNGQQQQVQQEVFLQQHIQPTDQDERARQAVAELYVDEALEYLNNKQQPGSSHKTSSPNVSGFVIEEEMLSSRGDAHKLQPGSNNKISRVPSGDGTSALIKTNEVFDKMEHDDHDEMTYAPEIQSVEIPPDQMSEASENFQEYFDKVAYEGQHAGHPRDVVHRKPLVDEANTSQMDSDAPAPKARQGHAPQFLSASGRRNHRNSGSFSLSSNGKSTGMSSDGYPRARLRKQSSLLSIMGVTSLQELLLSVTSLEALSKAMAKAGLESTNLIFGIDYTASNKYQGEDSFGGRSLHTIHPSVKNPYQQVITIFGRTLAPFASRHTIPVYGFGDAKTSDWSVFPLKPDGECSGLEEVLKVYNEVTPTVDLSGPTNFAPLIYQAVEICQKVEDYHILVIVADGQVTNEKATRRAIVQACQYPLSIIVVGVGDGPWDMMRVFDESLPKRSWDNFHFVEFHEIMRCAEGRGSDADVQMAVHSLLEIPDQYRCVCELGLVKRKSPHGSDSRLSQQHQ